MGSAFADDVVANRNSYGRVDALCGDSITRGFALGAFEDTIDPGDPLYLFRSIEATLNALLIANSATERVMWLTGFDEVSIVAFINADKIRATDTVVCQDAADPGMTAGAYYQKWRDVRDAVRGLDREFIGCTTFDYNVGSLGSLPENQFDLHHFAPDDYGTLNEAIRRGVAGGSDLGSRLIHMNKHMDTFRRLCSINDDLPAIYSDDIHPNVWGQTRMAGLYAWKLGLLPLIPDLDSLQDIVETNVASLQYGSSITGARARELLTLCFTEPS